MKTPCHSCGHPFDQELLGRYGCCNCHGEGLDEKTMKKIEFNWIEETLIPERNNTNRNDWSIDAVEIIAAPILPNKCTDIALKQDVWDGAGSDFGYAYIDLETLTLPSHFDNGRKVPQRFHKQVARLK